jgi:hypothetical protein
VMLRLTGIISRTEGRRACISKSISNLLMKDMQAGFARNMLA